MRTIISILFAIGCMNCSWAFDWNNLWKTRDQQAQRLMNQQQFSKAKATFDNPDWKAFAAFRAKQYQEAAQLYAQLKNNDYNRGNALAHAGQLKAAIQAYNKALATNPNDNDALYNRKIVEDLLKKQTNQNKKNNQSSNHQKPNKTKQNNQTNQTNQSKQPLEPNKANEPSDKQSKQSNQSEQSKQNRHQSSAEKEQQDAKKQWLQLIPDDPGGLMREKFLRDYLKRQQG